MRKLKIKFFSFKLQKFPLFFISLILLCILGQPVSAFVYSADQQQEHQQQHAVQPLDEGYDYDFKYSPEISASYSSSQSNDADEVDNSNYDVYEGGENGLGYSFNNNEKRSSKFHVYRRACIRRNGACDHRPKDCCHNSSCRCNLWGSNCRCQRMGLFQKWG